MVTIDYNGTGAWTVQNVRRRYADYAARHGVRLLADLTPHEHEERGTRWVYPVMDRVVEGIEAGDPACVDIGIDFIGESAGFPRGMGLKYRTARALRRATLTPEQRMRIRGRVIDMLADKYLPREFREYARLAKHIGMQDWLSGAAGRLDLDDPWVRHYFDYLTGTPRAEPTSR